MDKVERLETVRKGVRATPRSWIWLVYEGRNGPKIPSVATRRATLQARPRLFGQFQGEVRKTRNVRSLENRRSPCLGLSITLLCFFGWVRTPSAVRKGRFIMAKLIYSAIASLDGYVADEEGNFDWAAPDEEVHTFVNDLERQVGTHLYGRRMYEVMRYWETAHAITDRQSVGQDYAKIWRSADKIVYSKTLHTVSSARTRIERDFDAEAVRRMKAQSRRNISVGGPGLAARALQAGLVDECHLFFTPIVVGGGKRSFPPNVRLELELLDERHFEGGVVYLRYRTRT